MEQKIRQVVVGIIRNERYEICLTQRKEGTDFAGFWEFPGGKVEENERLERALQRELYEEIGIDVTGFTHWQTVKHCYGEKVIHLHFFLVEQWQGEPYGKENQPIKWVPQKQLDASVFPPANQCIVQALISA